MKPELLKELAGGIVAAVRDHVAAKTSGLASAEVVAELREQVRTLERRVAELEESRRD